MEFQLLNCFSFHRFAGLRDSSQIRGRTTIWTFKSEPTNTSRGIYGYVNHKAPRSTAQ